jgi:hypothetical protein
MKGHREGGKVNTMNKILMMCNEDGPSHQGRIRHLRIVYSRTKGTSMNLQALIPQWFSSPKLQRYPHMNTNQTMEDSM